MAKSLLKQFEGSEGRRRLISALTAQPLIQDQNLAIVIARRLELEAVHPGTNLIKQGASDTDLFLILDGAFSIAVNGRVVARKGAGEYVGEMAVVDPQYAAIGVGHRDVGIDRRADCGVRLFGARGSVPATVAANRARIGGQAAQRSGRRSPARKSGARRLAEPQRFFIASSSSSVRGQSSCISRDSARSASRRPPV